MQFGEMVIWVTSVTKRPDKNQDIKDAINAAILKYSLAASFADDRLEGTTVINAQQYAQSLIISTNLPRFRRIVYLKRTGQRGYLKMRQPNRIFDESGCQAIDVWYRSGDNLVFSMSALASSLDWCIMQYPPKLVNDADVFWMLDKIHPVIHAAACSDIFDSIGEPTDAKAKLARAESLFAIAKEDFEDASTTKAS